MQCGGAIRDEPSPASLAAVGAHLNRRDVAASVRETPGSGAGTRGELGSPFSCACSYTARSVATSTDTIIP